MIKESYKNVDEFVGEFSKAYQFYSALDDEASIAVGEGKEKVLVNNYKQSVQELAAMKSELKQLISDYGYLHNSYISRGET